MENYSYTLDENVLCILLQMMQKYPENRPFASELMEFFMVKEVLEVFGRQEENNELTTTNVNEEEVIDNKSQDISPKKNRKFLGLFKKRRNKKKDIKIKEIERMNALMEEKLGKVFLENKEAFGDVLSRYCKK